MDLLADLVVPIILIGLASLLTRRELHAHRRREHGDSDLFRYTKGRLVRRLSGIGLLAATGLTLGAWELWPPASPRAASLFLVVMLCEVVGLVVLGLVDLWETARTAQSADLSRQRGDSDSSAAK
jgi:hypothetical protein